METPTILDCGHGPDAGKPYGTDPATGATLLGWQWAYALDGVRKLCHACKRLEVLDCGHPIGPHSEVSTGYGTEPETGRRICFTCCADADKTAMIATGRATLYLQAPTRGQTQPVRKNYAVTNWPGSLSFVAFNYRHSRNGGGMGAQRTDVDFIGPDGYIWHAVNRGDNDLVRCKRTKRKAAPGIQGVTP